MNCLESLGQMVVRKCQQNSSLQRPRGDRGTTKKDQKVFGEPIHDCLPTVFQVEGFGEQQLNGRCELRNGRDKTSGFSIPTLNSIKCSRVGWRR